VLQSPEKTTHSAASATPWTPYGLLTSLLEYYTNTFIDAITKLSTHTLNQGLTDITSLPFIIVVTILRSVRHGH